MKSAILKSPLPYLALFAAHFIWGINFVVAKVALGEFPPMSLAFARFALACFLILPFLFSLESKKQSIKLEHLPKLILVGLLIVTLNIALFFEGIIRTTAINASVIMLSIPMMSVIGGWIFLKEKIYWINLVGLTFGFLGAIAIIGLPLLPLGALSNQSLIGNILLILSAISFVVGAGISKEMLKIYPPIIVTAIAFLVAMVSFFVPAVMEYLNNPNWIQQISILGILSLLYMAILSSVSAYFLLTWGLERTTLTQANLFQYMEPAVAATLAVPLLGERISFSFIIGTCLIVLGVYWGTLGKQEHHHHYHKHHRN